MIHCAITNEEQPCMLVCNILKILDEMILMRNEARKEGRNEGRKEGMKELKRKRIVVPVRENRII